LTETLRRATLLGSMCEGIKDASQRPSWFSVPWLRNTPSCAIVGRCAGCLLPIYRLW